MTCLARWPVSAGAPVVLLQVPGQQKHSQCESTRVSSFTSQHLLHCYLNTLAQKCTHTFNTISLEPPLILSRISVYYGISPKLGGVSELYCALKVLLSSGWGGKKRRDENDRAPFMCSVLSVEC